MTSTKTRNPQQNPSKPASSTEIGIISIKAHEAALRRKTEIRRMLEDLRFAAQAKQEAYYSKG